MQSSNATQTAQDEKQNKGDGDSAQSSALQKSMSVRDVVLRTVAKTTTVAVSFMMLRYGICSTKVLTTSPFH